MLRDNAVESANSLTKKIQIETSSSSESEISDNTNLTNSMSLKTPAIFTQQQLQLLSTIPSNSAFVLPPADYNTEVHTVLGR